MALRLLCPVFLHRAAITLFGWNHSGIVIQYSFPLARRALINVAETAHTNEAEVELACSAGFEEVLRTLEGHSGYATGAAVTPDGKLVVSASQDKTLKVWDLDTGGLIVTFHCDGSARCCAFADERRIVAGDGGGRLYILSLEE